jgi:hypothetical protein
MVRPIRSATREWKDAMVEIVDVTWFEQDRPALPGANIHGPAIGARSSDRSHTLTSDFVLNPPWPGSWRICLLPLISQLKSGQTQMKTALHLRFLVVTGTFVAAQLVTAQPNLSLPIAAGPFQPTMASLTNYHCPDWFRDAKFGIWAHWGPQAVPMDGDWYEVAPN